MKKNNPDTCLILILPPNATTLNFRREDRSKERIENDIQNLEIARGFDYVIVNDDLVRACNEILAFINNYKVGHVNACKW